MDAQPGIGFDDANAREPQSQLDADGPDGMTLGCSRREAQLVIIAARQHALQRKIAIAYCEARREGWMAWQRFQLDGCAQRRTLQDMTKVAHQAVGNVDRRVRMLQQALSQRDARLGHMQRAVAMLRLVVRKYRLAAQLCQRQ